MSYICISKTKLEEKLKELKEENSKLTDEHCVGHHYVVIGNINFLTELISSSIDAEEVFNAGREIISDWKDEGFYDLDDEGMQYNPKFKNNYLEYSKTLNI